MMRTFACFMFVVGITTNLFAGENTPTVGDQIFVTMTGDVAKEYHRLTSSEKDQQPKSGLSIGTSATIAQELKGGRYRIEHVSPIQAKGKPPRLVTFSTVIDASQLKTETTPKNTPVYSSPADTGPATVTQQEQKSLRLDLSELKDVKLRSWKLDEEVAAVAR